MGTCRVSVVIVSDYGDSSQTDWEEERLVLQAIKDQDFSEEIEVILVGCGSPDQTAPPDLYDLMPGLRTYFFTESMSFRLKDLAVQKASGELVAVIDADCLPDPHWLRLVVEDADQNPQVSAISGRTRYRADSGLKRALSLIDRAYIDRGKLGKAYHICNNAALYRRSFFDEVKFSYPDVDSPFVAGQIRGKLIKQGKYQLMFDPRVAVIHAFSGWHFEKDFRRNMGFLYVASYPELLNRRKIKSLIIPKFMWHRFRSDLSDCLRVGKDYIRWHDWVLVMPLLVIVRFLEIPGMLDCIRGLRKPAVTHFH
jgi:glycosyltransferase involved in cell wall biosynthesis